MTATGPHPVSIDDAVAGLRFLPEDGERPADLAARQLVVVPQGTWHRFETPDSVLVMSVTPQPTDHSTDLPT